MMQLTADEARVLGVLIEKGLTTPDQYPLTLNAVVNGSNQKNNRHPVSQLDEARVFDALEGLRGQGLVMRVDAVGSRTNRYRHSAGEVLHLRTAELAILAELMLRGPQTLGEVRGRASRMHPFESLEAVKGLLNAMAERSEPLVRDLPPSPGSRAGRYEQLLAPDAHPALSSDTADVGALQAMDRSDYDGGSLADRVARLEAEVSALRDALRGLATSLGESDPLAPAANPNPTTAEAP